MLVCVVRHFILAECDRQPPRSSVEHSTQLDKWKQTTREFAATRDKLMNVSQHSGMRMGDKKYKQCWNENNDGKVRRWKIIASNKFRVIWAIFMAISTVYLLHWFSLFDSPTCVRYFYITFVIAVAVVLFNRIFIYLRSHGMSHCFFCCEWIMIQPQFQKFFENSFPSDVCPLVKANVNNNVTTTQTNDCKRWWIVIDAVRTYCGLCRLQPPKTVWIHYCYVVVARIFYGTTSLVLSFVCSPAWLLVRSFVQWFGLCSCRYFFCALFLCAKCRIICIGNCGRSWFAISLIEVSDVVMIV